MTAARTESTAVARADGERQPKGVIAMFETPSARALIEPFLPEGADVRRVVASVRLAIGANPQLARCTPESLILSAAKIQQWGLEIGTTAHLVPFGTVCTPIADYKGLAELVIASGAVRDVEAHIVYEREHFRMEQGMAPVLEHHVIATASERGKPIGAYVIFRIGVHRDRSHYMTVEEIEAIRQKYSKQWKSGELPTWYMLKTVVRHGVKLLPKNPRIAAVFQRMEQIEAAETLDELPAPTTVRALPGTPLTALGTKGSAGQAMRGYEGAELPAERIETTPDSRDPYQADFIDDRDLDEEAE